MDRRDRSSKPRRRGPGAVGGGGRRPRPEARPERRPYRNPAERATGGRADAGGAAPRSTLPRHVAADVRSTARAGQATEVIRLLEEAVDALGRGRAGPAERAASRAKGLAPRSASVREVLGLAHYEQERFREALAELRAYRRMSGRVDQNHLIADCQRALGAPEKAIPLVEEALRQRLPDEVRAEAVVVGASALADLGRYEEALSLLRRYPTREDVGRPHDLRVWYVTGDVLARAGRRADAAREFRRILRHDRSAFDVAERLAALS